jgi:uncharacterized membrane protein (UPF0127 family)
MRRHVALALLVAAACHGACDGSGGARGAAGAATSDEEFVILPAGASVEDVLKAVDGRPDKNEGLKTPGHGTFYFLVLRDGERHGTAYRPGAFHAVIGAGLTLPEGTLSIRRVWATSGQIDGKNEEPERWGVSVAVEPGAAKPYPEKIRVAAATFAEALSERIPLHPDCVLAMGEVAYANTHAADPSEKELAKAARARVRAPGPDVRVVIRSGGQEIDVDAERRTGDGIMVGMMFRTRFDGESRGMLFEYPHAAERRFWMKNCRIPIDVAYVYRGRVEKIWTMESGFGADRDSLRQYPSDTSANLALEMPAGWFEKRGIKRGDELVVGRKLAGK